MGIIEIIVISQTSRKELGAALKGTMRWENKRLAEYVEELKPHKASASPQDVS